MSKRRIIQVKESSIKVINHNDTDYISLTDMTGGFREGSGLIGKWITNKNTLEYLGVWESLKNDYFNYSEFEVIKNESGVNRFVMSVGQWIERTKAIGMTVSTGRYGSTFAHKDIAFHFAMWLSPEFQIYLINEFQRLKDEEQKNSNLEWNLQRTLTKVNYFIHTDSIKENLIPLEISKTQASLIYASEADLLNVALFGITANEWREKNPTLKGNIRDYSTLEQLVVLSNLESINALLIKQKITQKERLIQLNKVAITQMKSLVKHRALRQLE